MSDANTIRCMMCKRHVQIEDGRRIADHLNYMKTGPCEASGTILREASPADFAEAGLPQLMAAPELLAIAAWAGRRRRP